jgi:DNA helicase II / ATP-dependent DNA helicase PcrA
MTIAPEILREYPAMNEAQKEVVGHLDGPMLAIAGPGSGKTFSLVLRATNLFLLRKCKPSELILCTFTEKAAYELRDRIAATAQKVEYAEDLSELRVGTIHGICNRIIAEHRHRTPLGSGYETLDDLGQLRGMDTR